MEEWLEPYADACFRRSADIAHDLKTPLNIAVLNLELLRMRARKICGTEEDDPRLLAYTKAIELELRRLARIFDAFFILSVPPRRSPEPVKVDVDTLFCEIATNAGYPVEPLGDEPCAMAHEERSRELFRYLLEGAGRNFARESILIERECHTRRYLIRITGKAAGDIEVEKLFKFYYTAPDGNPDLSLAAARLIAETQGGGTLTATPVDGNLVLELSLPTGER